MKMKEKLTRKGINLFKIGKIDKLKISTRFEKCKNKEDEERAKRWLDTLIGKGE